MNNSPIISNTDKEQEDDDKKKFTRKSIWENNTYLLPIMQDIDSEMSEGIIRELIMVSLEKDIEMINFIINSHGGSLSSAISILNMMRSRRKKIGTIVMGNACSSAFLISISGEKGYRKAYKNALFMSHSFWVSEGSFSFHEIKERQTSFELEYERIRQIIRRNSSIKKDKDIDWFLRTEETWFDAKDALKLGFIDKIIDC